MAYGSVERRLRWVRPTQRYVLNPPMKLLAWTGLAPGLVVLDTRGRLTGLRRRNVVGMMIEGSLGWVVAEHGRHAGWVRNVEANPEVVVRIERQWRWARAEIAGEDDPHARLEQFNRPAHARAVRRFGTDLTTVRFDFGCALGPRSADRS